MLTFILGFLFGALAMFTVVIFFFLMIAVSKNSKGTQEKDDD